MTGCHLDSSTVRLLHHIKKHLHTIGKKPLSHKPLPDDENLIQLLLAEDHDTYLQVVKAYHPQMISLARGVIGEAFAEEVVQEAWLSMARGLPRFERRSSFKTWLMRIVINGAKSRLRRESRNVSLGEHSVEESPVVNPQRFNKADHWSQPPIAWSSDDPAALLSSQQLGDCLDKTVSALPDKQRAALELYDQQQLNSQEVCNYLEVSESNLRVMLHRARSQIRNMIERFHEDGTC